MKKLTYSAAVLACATALVGCNMPQAGGVKELKTDSQKFSYMLGQDMGSYIKSLGVDVDLAALSQGIADTVTGKKPLLTPEQATLVREAFRNKMQEAQASKSKGAVEKNAKDGAAYIEKFKAEAGVITTKSGLMYKIITEGKGAMPKATDKVKVHYTGMLVDGKVFDSSVQRGQPAEFPVMGVIPGWSEALQLMKVGEKIKLVLPSELAYGERGAGQDIGPGATLVFEVELIDIVK